uniref:Uncharacterized protein n=1 Tax=Chlamydomonas leiostraca TaxID=1034604 RepID=A0A7S0WJ24_9CHLO
MLRNEVLKLVRGQGPAVFSGRSQQLFTLRGATTIEIPTCGGSCGCGACKPITTSTSSAPVFTPASQQHSLGTTRAYSSWHAAHVPGRCSCSQCSGRCACAACRTSGIASAGAQVQARRHMA